MMQLVIALLQAVTVLLGLPVIQENPQLKVQVDFIAEQSFRLSGEALSQTSFITEEGIGAAPSPVPVQIDPLTPDLHLQYTRRYADEMRKVKKFLQDVSVGLRPEEIRVLVVTNLEKEGVYPPQGYVIPTAECADGTFVFGPIRRGMCESGLSQYIHYPPGS